MIEMFQGLEPDKRDIGSGLCFPDHEKSKRWSFTLEQVAQVKEAMKAVEAKRK